MKIKYNSKGAIIISFMIGLFIGTQYVNHTVDTPITSKLIKGGDNCSTNDITELCNRMDLLEIAISNVESEKNKW